MSILKKALAVLLATLLFVAVLPVSTMAAEACSASCAASGDVACGEEVTVTVSLDSLSASALAIVFGSSYDPSVFEFVSAEWLLADGLLCDVDTDKQNAVIAYASATELSGAVFSYTLRALEDAAAGTYTIQPSIVVGNSGSNVNATVTGCSVKVGAEVEEEGTVVATKVAGTVTFTVYEMSDGSHKLVVTGTGAIPAWAELANYSATLKTIEIGEGIVNIGYGVFQNLSALESVSLPSTLTTITGAAFNNDKNLTTINLGEGLTTIGYKAFYGTGLVEVTIPNSVTTMGTWVFADCKQLTTVTFGASNLDKKTLPSRTFSGCTALKNVDLGSKLRTIDDYAFFNCGLENLYLPANIKVVDNAAFYSSASLKTVEIADGGAIYLGWASFYRCTALESFDMGDSVTQIGSWVFTACAEMTSIELPETVTSIGRRTFSWCSGLESIALPSGVTVINAELFYSCTSLAEVTMSADVTQIASKAFYKCLALTSLEYPESATVAKDAFTASGLV